MPIFSYFNTLFLCVWLQFINEVKFIHQGEGHIKVKVKYLQPFKFYVAHTFCKRVVCIRLNAFLLLKCLGSFNPQEMKKFILHLNRSPSIKFSLIEVIKIPIQGEID